MTRSKRYLSISNKIDFNQIYEMHDAVELLYNIKTAKFDETAECVFVLNVEHKKVDQHIRGSVVLPYGLGKKFCIVVIAQGEQAQKAQELGADFVGDQELIRKISNGWTDFDVLISVSSFMPSLTKLGKLLGPKGLMPNPKLGTMTEDVEPIIKDIRKGRMEYKTDKFGNLHSVLGKLSFNKEQLTGNLVFLYNHLISIKPKTVKGEFIKNITISSTMSPGIKVDLLSIR
ncbi:50S ribosomal protein L1 ['Crotalaria aegyptiaca' phytoplasma]|uniref:Large ribosomal subunit protein uL1 n=1 Tax=Candidatus Phytoplasma crotalariae TaxID=2982627 RepID=A0ABT9D212_9MOLU|nr:50S ribosomal protein L1 ['Crotalaria aegyptiaca' phytoplasma]MDO8059049.1 50S ribosomal protein L1 ['Crotalaria aegyptiaca' phytoplasma]